MEHVINLIGHKLLFENIVSAENCTLTDSSGNRYLDLESGVWCTSIGHGNKAVTAAVVAASNSIMHSGYCYNAPQVELTARKILSITDHGNGQCVFLCSGSEVVDLGISIAKHITKKRLLLTMSDSYLSAFGNFANADSPDWRKFNWLAGESVDDIPFGDIAAFVFEPGSSSGMVRFPPTGIVNEIARRVRSCGGLVIANEVTTGIGRTGEWFGYNHYGIEPDMVAIGKGLGNGYPVSCLSLSGNVARGIDLAHFHYSQSHQNDPMGATVAYAVLETVENRDLIRRSRDRGAEIMRRLDDLRRRYGIIREVRGRGLMIAIEFDDGRDESVATAIHERLLEKRIILVKRPNLEVFRLDPALTITDEDISYFIDSLGEILSGL